MRIEIQLPKIQTDISNLEKMYPTGWEKKVKETTENLLKTKEADRAVVHYQIHDNEFVGYTIHFWKGEDRLDPPEIIKEHTT